MYGVVLNIMINYPGCWHVKELREGEGGPGLFFRCDRQSTPAVGILQYSKTAKKAEQFRVKGRYT